MRLNLEQNKECLISLSRFKFSLVINGFTDILKSIDNTVSRQEEDEKNIALFVEIRRTRSREKHLWIISNRPRCRGTMPCQCNASCPDRCVELCFVLDERSEYQSARWSHLRKQIITCRLQSNRHVSPLLSSNLARLASQRAWWWHHRATRSSTGLECSLRLECE